MPYDSSAAGTFAGLIDGANTVYTLAAVPQSEPWIFADRQRMRPGIDYARVGSQITFLPAAFPVTNGAPPANTILDAYYDQSIPIAATGIVYPTLAEVISAAAKQLKLSVVDIADPFTSGDASIIQMLSLLADVGKDLVGLREWRHLQIEYSFNTVQGVVLYPLPSGMRRKIDQTGWNRTTRFPLGGPLSPQEYQYLKAVPAPATITVLFRPRNGQIEIYPPPGAASQTIAFEYLTSFWIALTGGIVPVKDEPTAASDVLLFPKTLLVRALKNAWKRDNGLDSTATEQDYQQALDAAMDDDAEAPVLRIDGRGPLRTRLIDASLNVPSTGFGIPN